MLGDLDGFHQWSDKIITRQKRDENPLSVAWISLAILTMPPQPEELEWVRTHLVRLRSAIPEQWDSGAFFVKGLAEYRASDYRDARHDLKFVMSGFGKASRLIVLAMCRQKLNEPDKARDLLRQARQIINPSSSASKTNQETESDNFVDPDRLMAQTFLREAEALILKMAVARK